MTDKKEEYISHHSLHGETLFEHALDGLAHCRMIFDKKGSPVDWIHLEVNKNFEKLTGLEEAEGKKITELIPNIKKLNPELFKVFGRASLIGRSDRIETYIEPLSKWFLISVYSSQKKYFVVSFQDITKYKEADWASRGGSGANQNIFDVLRGGWDKLVESEATKEAILGSIGEGVIATDKSGIIIFLNKAAENMLGWSMEEATGKIVSDIISIEDEEGNKISKKKRPIRIALDAYTDTTVIGERGYYYITKQGTKLPVTITATPIFVKGEVIGAIEAFRDITKEKEVKKVRADFLSLAAHQLRTPLSGTKWMIETLQREILGPLTKKQKEYLDQLHKINERMVKLVSDMLNILRLESDSVLTKNKTISINNLFENFLSTMVTVAESRGIVLRNATKDHRTAVLETDPTILRIVLESLISNGIDYSRPDGEVILNAEEKSDKIIFSVKDNGIGIPEDEQKDIFKRFYRASNGKKHKPEGTGLGLNIALMLVDKLGGRIYFESEENKGSVFFVEIPKVAPKST